MFPCGYCANATVLHAGSVTRLTHHSLYLVLHITQELLGPESDLLMQAGINPPLEVILYPSWLYIQGSYMLRICVGQQSETIPVCSIDQGVGVWSSPKNSMCYLLVNCSLCKFHTMQG